MSYSDWDKANPEPSIGGFAAWDKANPEGGIPPSQKEGTPAGVYVKPVMGLSSKQTAALYGVLSGVNESVSGIAQWVDEKLLGGSAGIAENVSAQRKTLEQLENSKEYRQATKLGYLAGGVADPITYLIPFGKAKTVKQFVALSSLSGGALGAVKAKTNEESRATNAAFGVFGGALGGALIAKGIQLFGKGFQLGELTKDETSKLKEVLLQEHPDVPENQLDVLLQESQSAHKHISDLFGTWGNRRSADQQELEKAGKATWKQKVKAASFKYASEGIEKDVSKSTRATLIQERTRFFNDLVEKYGEHLDAGTLPPTAVSSLKESEKNATTLAQKQADAFLQRVFVNEGGVNADAELAKLATKNPKAHEAVIQNLEQAKVLHENTSATGKITDSFGEDSILFQDITKARQERLRPVGMEETPNPRQAGINTEWTQNVAEKQASFQKRAEEEAAHAAQRNDSTPLTKEEQVDSAWESHEKNAGDIVASDAERLKVLEEPDAFNRNVQQVTHIESPIERTTYRPRGKSGNINPNLQVNLGAASAGAAIGAIEDKEDPLTGALAGAGIFLGGKVGLAKALAAAGKESPKVAESFLNASKYLAGQVGANINSISPEIGLHVLSVEAKKIKDVHSSLDKAQSFFKFYEQSLTSDEQALFKQAWLNQSRENIEKALASHPEVAASFKQMTIDLRNIGEELSKRGMTGLRENYLPRVVIDLKGLREAIGTHHAEGLEKALHEKARSLGLQGSANLPEVEMSNVVNTYLRKVKVASPRAGGYTKARSLDNIPEEYSKFFASPIESYHSYMERVHSDIAMHDFFGKSAVKNVDGSLDIGLSIGSKIGKEMAKGKMSAKDFIEMESNLKKLYMSGKSTAQWAQAVGNMETISTLADLSSSAQNIASLVSSGLVYYGIRPTIAAVVQQGFGKHKLSIKDFGLLDHMSDEFVNNAVGRKLSNQVMKYTGWPVLDAIDKNTAFNASLIRATTWAKTEGGIKSLERRYGKAFGDKFPSLVQDLQSGNVSDQVKLMAMWDVSQHQPLTRLSRTQFQLDNPTIGSFTNRFKSFMLSQMNWTRENALRQIKQAKTYREVSDGISTLGKWALGMGMMGASSSAIQSAILGRDIELDWDAVAMAGLRNMGYNSFAADKLVKGDVKGAVADYTMTSFKAPSAALALSHRLITGTEATPKEMERAASVLPMGKTIYSRFFGGAEQYNEKIRSK